jgi:RHS repeat-associated protein
MRDAQNGRLTGSTLNTVNDSWNYTGFGEAQSYVAAAGSTALYAMSFTRDHAGRITTKTETLGGVTSVYSYTYDAARGWLTDVSSNGLHTAHYDYDDNGNRTGALTLDREVSYAAADGQDRITGGTLAQPLQAAQNVSWSYTANGEVAGRTVGTATTLYSYDVRGNLRDVTLTNGVRIEYPVDATGRRLGRKVGGTLTRGWLYQDGLKPVAELDGAGNVVSRFVYGGKANVPEYLVKNGAEYRLITDQLGSVRLVVNAADRSLAQRLDYDEFGRVLNDSNPGFQPFGYAGGLYDPDTGLVRFGARDYDADAGRWMSKDPIGFEGGNNWYAYVGNNPVNFIDPLGLAWWQFWNWSIFNWNKPSLPQSTINNINSPGSGVWIDPNLSDENNFDHTIVGGFSLNNLANGNLGEYGKSVEETLAVKGPIYLVGRNICPKVASVALEGVSVVGTALTVGATANDLSNGFINNTVNEVWDSSAGPAGPGEAYVGDGIIESDMSDFLQ